MYHLGRYLPGSSPVHRMDPRIKILSVLALSIVILKAGGFGAIFLISLFLAASGTAGGMKPRHFAEALRPLVFFLVVLFLMHLFFTPGRPIAAFYPGITVTAEGLNRGILTAWQFAALVAGSSILTMTTSPSELIGGIERLLRPFRRVGVPSHDIAVMISLALRFVPTLLDEAGRIRKAQLARGAAFTGANILHRIKAVATLAVPLTLGSFRRAEELARSMESRGYARGGRTYLRELRLSPGDYAASAVVAAFLAALRFL